MIVFLNVSVQNWTRFFDHLKNLQSLTQSLIRYVWSWMWHLRCTSPKIASHLFLHLHSEPALRLKSWSLSAAAAAAAVQWSCSWTASPHLTHSTLCTGSPAESASQQPARTEEEVHRGEGGGAPHRKSCKSQNVDAWTHLRLQRRENKSPAGDLSKKTEVWKSPQLVKTLSWLQNNGPWAKGLF